MRPCRLFIVALFALTAAGCVQTMRPAAVEPIPMPPPIVVAETPVPASSDAPYRLGPGDRLRVVVFGQEGLTNSYSVGANGAIAMPLIGSVPAGGRTTTELSRAIAARLRQGYIREPHVAVEIETYRPFFILGEVTNPGQYAFVANMTVETAVAIAGGFTPRAYKSTANLTRGIDGVLTRSKVPMVFPVQPGDTIRISERWF